MLQTTPFDPADYIESEEDVLHFVKVSMEDGDLKDFLGALECVFRSKAWARYADISPERTDMPPDKEGY